MCVCVCVCELTWKTIKKSMQEKTVSRKFLYQQWYSEPFVLC